MAGSRLRTHAASQKFAAVASLRTGTPRWRKSTFCVAVAAGTFCFYAKLQLEHAETPFRRGRGEGGALAPTGPTGMGIACKMRVRTHGPPPGPRRPGRWAILRSKFCDECGAEPPSRAPRPPRPLPRQPRPRSGAAPTAQEEEVGSSRSLAVAATPEAATMGKQKSGTYIRPCQCLPQKHMRAPFASPRRRKEGNSRTHVSRFWKR